MHVRRADNRTPQPMHGRLEAQSCAGRGLVEQGGHDQAAREILSFASFEIRSERIGKLKNPLDLAGGQILDRNDIVFAQPRHRFQAVADLFPPPITTSSTPSTSASRTYTRWSCGASILRPT